MASLLLGLLAWQGSTEIATGGGERGPWQQNQSRYDYVDDPTVALGEGGEVSVAWVDQARKDLFFQRIASGKPVNVSRSPATFSWLPRIALAPHEPQTVLLLWQEIIFSGGSHGGEILFARSEDGGATFSAPLNLSRSVAGDGKGRTSAQDWHNGSLDLAAGAGGALYAAWTEYEGALWLRRSTDGGKTFKDRIKIHDATPARGPSLALGPEGAVYLAWTDGDIHVARSTNGGASFAEPQVIAPGRGYADAPKLAVDPDGVLHLVYEDHDRILYARSSDGARSFGPLRDISGRGAEFPALGIDGKGALYVLWERPRGLALIVSRDGGRTFAPPSVVPGSVDPSGAENGNLQGLLTDKLAVNRHGALAIVNSSFEENEHSRVWLMRATRTPQE